MEVRPIPRWLITICALTIAAGAYFAVWSQHAYFWGVVPQNGITDGVAPIRVNEASPAHELGLRTGDRVDLHAMPLFERIRLYGYSGWRSDDRLTLPIVRGSGLLDFTIPHQVYRLRGDLEFEAYAAGLYWMALFGLFIAFRSGGRRQAHLLAAVLMLGVTLDNFFGNGFVTPWPIVDALVQCAHTFFNPSWSILLSIYAISFGTLTPLRRFVQRLLYATAAVAALLPSSAYVAALAAGTFPAALFTLADVAQVGPPLLSIVACALAFRATVGSKHASLVWSAVPFQLHALAYVFFRASYVLPIPGAYASGVVAAAAFLAPLGLTYALLNRRLIDIAFVLNRALVYSGVSVVVVALFVLVEWAATAWLQGLSHTESLIVGGGAALVIGVLLRTIHRQVDGALDWLFFRKRHENEEAIRTFAQEAPYVTDRATLLRRTEALLEMRADASFAQVLLPDQRGIAGYDIDDPALVAARAHKHAIDLHRYQTAIAGDLLYPMFSRGAFQGVIVLGPRRSGESFAPDEMSAIDALANGVADALDGAAVAGTLASIERELAALADAQQRIVQALAEQRQRERT